MSQMPTFILPFSSRDATLESAGGKGANLAELARAGFNIPPGFIVTTETYRTFVETHRIQKSILLLAASASPENPDTFDNASTEIRALFDRCTPPGEIASPILSAYRALAHSPDSLAAVAIRSSATAEDLPGLAFAGQQETYLNVIGEDSVLQAVKRCWASLWTARAIAYRSRNAIPSEQIALAVVVQEMVASEISGVLFTANPLTGRRDEIVVDASFGLGEAIVSGQVEPDHYVVDPHEWKITERALGDKAVAIVPRAGGGTEQIEQHKAEQQALDDARIISLAQTAQRVAQHFGSPQDIEWAWAGEQLHLLQSRPITSLYPLPDTPPPESGLYIYFNINSIQGVTDPLTPLGIDVLRIVLSGAQKILRINAAPHEFIKDAGGRLFVDVTWLARDPRLRHVLLAVLERGDPAARPVLLRLYEQNRIPTAQVLTPLRGLALFRALFPIWVNVLSALRDPEKGRARALARMERLFAKMQSSAASGSDLAGRLSTMERELPRAFEEIVRGVFPVIAPSIGGIFVLQRWLAEWLGESPSSALELTRGLPANVTTEMDLVLWNAAQSIRADPATHYVLKDKPFAQVAQEYREGRLPAVAQHALDGFLQRYGMRAIAEIDFGRPRWREDPNSILQTVLSYLQVEDPNGAPDAVFRRGAEHAEQRAAEFTKRVRATRGGWLRARLLAAMIRRVRILGGMREAPKFLAIRIMDCFRTGLLTSAHELVARGQLGRAEDVFFVPFNTLRQFAAGQPIDLRRIVAHNRAEYERECRRKQMPRLLLSTGEAFYQGMADTQAGAENLVGDPVSPGVVEGIVHVVLDPRGVHLAPGEILVCPATDPGWTPLFLTAGGLVMEIGGLVTHGAVVAREYGIPAIVGVHQATSRLYTGQRVRVDGSHGLVTLLPDA